ncbi:MAG: phosphoribosylamine--glycine ligase, partial [Armatimonadota bacterium]|nr:phosphoribosylamine--glycine ligase [Armatimonadota bacterium]
MRVLVVGGGAREHALAWKIRQSPLLTSLMAAPGNPGIAAECRCVPVQATDIEGIVRLALEERIDLVVVGPEDPLAAGLVDELQKNGIAAFGPGKMAAKLEASKTFAKELMLKNGIPTARHATVTSIEDALAILPDWDMPLVIKADGLARGRGVRIVQNRQDAETTLHEYMVQKVFGEPGATVVLEEYLEGEEVSLIALCDGETVLPLAAAEDHKPLLDGDQGPNTGGMGCFSPVPVFGNEQFVMAQSILQKVVDALRAEGTPFRGALFAGLILTAAGPRVLEFNVRFGDPETEVILPRMKSDLLPLLHASAVGSLKGLSAEWRHEAAVCVILSSGGYPGKFETGKPISGLDAELVQASANDSVINVFHAGTAMAGGEVVSAGGRVLAVTALGKDLEDAR